MRLHRRTVRAVGAALGVASLATAYACGCTDVGCYGGISLQVTAADGSAPSAFSGTLRVSGEALTFTCPNSGQGVLCFGEGSVLIMADVVEEPETVTITVTSSAGETFAGDVEPDYQDHNPNGAFCGPACTSGQLALTLGR